MSRLPRPLNKEAVKKTDEEFYANHPELVKDGKCQPLNVKNPEQAKLREEWITLYHQNAKKDKNENENNLSKPAIKPCQKKRGILVATVKTPSGKPIEGATVEVKGQGWVKLTDKDGTANFGEVPERDYTVEASKDGYSQKEKFSETKQVPGNVTTVFQLQLVPLENIIFIGSEMYYNSFWWKMMFIATGFSIVDRKIQLRSAFKNTIVFADIEYTWQEKFLSIGLLRLRRQDLNLNIKSIHDTNEVINYINNRDNEVGGILIQDIFFFCHGVPGRLALNFNNSPDIDITIDNLPSINANVFSPDGLIYSYACRTGISRSGKTFQNDGDAEPENSLAQKMANHFRVNVYAFLTRTDYGEVLRIKGDSERISTTLKNTRSTMEGEIIQIPPDHETLPHPGLGGWGEWREGTDKYALWRKQGAIEIPSSGSTPIGLSKGMKLFTPT